MSAVIISYLQEITAWIKIKKKQTKNQPKGEFLPTNQHTANLNDYLLYEKKEKSRKNLYKETFLSRFSLVKLELSQTLALQTLSPLM